MNNFYRQIKKNQSGQSLVEIAVTAPLLLLMLLGLFEVGWALRGYMVLANVNRETVRFAVKSNVLDFSEKADTASEGFNEVLSHTTDSLAGQLNLEFLDDPNATIIMSHLVIDTGYPCVEYANGEPVLPYEFDDDCDCTTGDSSDPDGDGTAWFSRDDLVLHPGLPGYSAYAQTYGLSNTTRLGSGSYEALAETLKLENNQLNCSILKTSSAGEMTSNNLFISEMFYEQPQLLGAPLISNRFTDPIPFYAHTTMRIVTGRDSNTSDTIGPACELAPLTLKLAASTAENTVLAATTYAWVAWNPDEKSSTSYLVEALNNFRLANNDFTDAGDSTDTVLSTDDSVTLSTATTTGKAALDESLTDLVDQTVQIPVYTSASGHIDHIAQLKISAVVTSTKTLTATFLGYEDLACEE